MPLPNRTVSRGALSVYLRRPIVTMPSLPLSQLVRMTPSKTKIRSNITIGHLNKVSINTIPYKGHPPIKVWEAIGTYKGHTIPNARYTTVVRFFGPVSFNTHIWVTCSCDDFKFRCETVLARLGASSLIFSNGKSPVMTNPRRRTKLCKHLIDFVDRISRMYRNYPLTWDVRDNPAIMKYKTSTLKKK